MKETMKQAGYNYIGQTAKGLHILADSETGKRELWACNKNHASYGIIFKNTHLEFCTSLDRS